LLFSRFFVCGNRGVCPFHLKDSIRESDRFLYQFTRRESHSEDIRLHFVTGWLG
jgi:hypothetical protein